MVCIKRFVLFRHSLYFGVEWIFKSMICNCLDAGSLQIGFIQIQCLIMRPRKILLNHFVISFKREVRNFFQVWTFGRHASRHDLSFCQVDNDQYGFNQA